MKLKLQLNSKIYFLIAFSVLISSFSNKAKAQVATAYTFTSGNANPGVPLGAPTTLANSVNTVYPNIPIGFKFKFNGTLYDTLGISSNGFVWFGNTTPAGTVTDPISDPTAYAGAIAAFGQAIEAQSSGTFGYETQGTAPNRTFTVEWYNFVGVSDYSNGINTMDYYVILYECSGVIKTVENAEEYGWLGTVSGQIGIRGESNADYFNRSVNCATGSKWTSSTAGTSNVATCKLDPCYPGTISGTPCTYTYTPVSSNVPTITCTDPNTACTGTSIGVPVTISSGQIPYSINWSFTNGAPTPPSGNASNVSSPYSGVNTTYGSAATSNYDITVTDANGCQATCNGNITVTACGANSITTSAVTGSPFCACTNVSVPFTSSGTFNAGNYYKAELSDASGNFTSPDSIGVFASTANSGTISATIPCNATSGTGYMIRVVSSNPGTTGAAYGPVTINAAVTPSVSVAANPSGAICHGISVTFTATPTNGGTPTYQWKINGVTQAGTADTLTRASLNNNDVVTVVMTSTATCASPATATSAPITMTVTTSLTASVSVSASPGDTICSGNEITFTAIPVNGGTPTYQWNLNSNIVGGATSNTYSPGSLNNGDNVTVTMTSNAGCVSVTTVTSPSLIVTVNPPLTPSVSIVSNDTTICPGTTVNFTAIPTNGGSSPSYQWFLNGGQVGTNSPDFYDGNLAESDIVYCTITSSLTCVSESSATSDPITMSVRSIPQVAVNIQATPGTTVCSGTTVNFTANSSNGGLMPKYQWVLNGVSIAGDTDVIYSNSNLQNGDSVSCILLSSVQCASPVTAAEVHITITTSINPGTISTPKNIICEGTVAHLSLSGNSSDSIQWQSSADSTTGFTNLAGETSATYATSPLSSSTYFRVLDGSGNCKTPTISLQIEVEPAPVASFTSSVGGGGRTVTFTADSSTGTTSYYWSFGDGTSSTVRDPVHTFNSDSTYHVCLTVDNSSDCTFTLCQNEILTGINNINDAEVWQIYPDPFSSQLYISVGQGAIIVESIEIYDVLGRKVLSNNINGVMENPMKMDVSDLKAGVYYLSIRTRDNAFVKPVVKQ